MEHKRGLPTNTRLRLLLLVLATGLGVLGLYYIRFDTGRYSAQSPVWRWKFAIYRGECDDETGCHFEKMPGTGLLEYVGLKAIPRLEAEITEPFIYADSLEYPSRKQVR